VARWRVLPLGGYEKRVADFSLPLGGIIGNVLAAGVRMMRTPRGHKSKEIFAEFRFDKSH
jgi:hypothetical protein